MLTDLKELKKFFKLCREHGVTDVSFEGITVKFGDLPRGDSPVMESEEIPTDALTPDELIYYAVGSGGAMT